MDAACFALRIGATFFFMVMIVFVKLLADDVPLDQLHRAVVFFVTSLNGSGLLPNEGGVGCDLEAAIITADHHRYVT